MELRAGGVVGAFLLAMRWGVFSLMAMTSETLLKDLRWRYATKQFDSAKKIPADLWSAVEESLALTPSSFGLQPWHFVVVTDEAIRAELTGHSWGQPQVAECSHFLVLTARKDIDEAYINAFIADTAAKRGVAVESLEDYRQMMVGFVLSMDDEARFAWAKLQTYIALGQVMSSAAHLGLDACPMEGISPVEYDRILGLEEKSLGTTVACAFGYRSEGDKYAELAKVRDPLETLITGV